MSRLIRALRWSLFAAVLWTVPAEADWGPTAVVDRARFGSMARPQLTVGPSGTIAAVWLEDQLDNKRLVRYASRRPGQAWSSSWTVSETDSEIVQLELALDARDDPTIVWTVSDQDGRRRVQTNRPFPWYPWEPPVTLAVDASSPTVAIDDDGTATVLFAAGDHPTRSIGAVSRPQGDGWSAVEQLPASATSQAPRLVNRPDTGLTALWLESATVLRSSDLGAAGWSAPVTVDATAGLPDLKVTASGDVIAAWRGTSGVEVAQRDTGASWSAAVAVAAATQAEGVRVALNASDDATAVWTASGRPYASSRLLTGAWGPAVALSQATNATGPSVVLDANGVATAVWESRDATGARRATRAANGAWAAPVSLSTAGEWVAPAAPLVIDGAGDVTAAWVSAEYAPEGARSRLLSSTTGPSVVSETEILSGPADGSYTREDRATYTFNGEYDAHCSTSLGSIGWCRSPFEMWLLKDGPHRFAVAVGSDATAATRTVHRDSTPPSVAISVAGTGDIERIPLGARVDVSLHVTDNGSGVHSHAAPGPLFTGAPGRHRYTATARDNVGNVGEGTFDYAVEAPVPAPLPAPTPTPVAPRPVTVAPKLLAGKRPTITGLLRSGVTLRYRAVTPGRLTVQWRAGRALVARSATAIARAGTVTVRIRPTAGGRRLLKKRKSATLTASTTFATEDATDTSTTVVTLRRGTR